MNVHHVQDGHTREQLRFFDQMGLLSWRPNPEQLARLVNLHDDSADLERRARSYFHVNCAHCHQFNAGGSANIALGFEIPLDQTRALDVRPIQGTFDIDGARVIAPGSPSRSVLYYRISKLGGGRMPRIGSNQVDLDAVRVIHDWIAGMKSSPGAAVSKEQAPAAFTKDKAALATIQASRSLTVETRASIQQLCSSTRGALLLLGDLDWANVPESIRREIVTVTRNSPHVEVRDLFERFIPESERIRRLGDVIDRRVILALPGNLERGKSVFATNPAAQCKTCQKLGPIGETIGPDLSKIGSKYDKSAMLDHIIEPSKTIDPQYASYLVETKDGQVYSGIVFERTESAVLLKDAQGKTTRIRRDQVEQLAPQPKSLMPELLLRDLTAQQAADLLEYLAAQR